MKYFKRIIIRMIEFAKRWGPTFFTAFIASSLALIPILLYLESKPYLKLVLIFWGFLVLATLTMSVIALVYDIKEALRKDNERKGEVSHKELVKAFMRSGMDEKSAEIAATGRTEPYQPIDGLDDNGWVTPKEAYKRHKKNKSP